MWTNTVHTGQADGPMIPENWKRAVYRLPPSRFTVEMLPPVKLGGNYNFQMRITPIARGDRASVSSKGSNTEYEILRRWEDCLIFQDTLEREYARLAQSKRERLVAGKGVRKNGIYLVDRASSWESLPPGPEPDSVALSIHDLVPKLTKRGTMFRASQATTDQRQAELTAFIAALWTEHVPTLLEDFRQDRTVTDFFGFWRRDQDIQRSPKKARPSSRNSVTSSFYSPYYSAAGESGDDVACRPRAYSSASSDSSSSPSTGSARSSISVQITLDDKPVAFGHNPHHGADVLESLREDSEITRRPSNRGGFLAAMTKRVRKTPTEVSGGKRDRPSLDGEQTRPDSRACNATTTNRGHRESWQTTASGMSFLNDLNLTLPDQPDEDARVSRMSMASIATFRTEVSSEGVIPRYYVPEPNPARLSVASFMTDVSADAIIPRSPRRPDSRATLSQGHQRTSSIASDGESVLDEYFYDAFPRPCSFIPEAPPQSRPETPVGLAKLPESPKTPPEQQTASPPAPAGIEPAKTALPTSPSLIRLPSSPISPVVSEFAVPRSPSSPTPGSPRTPASANFYQRKDALARGRSPSPNGSMVSASMSVLSESTMQSSFSDSTGTTITPSLYSFYSARSTISSTTTASSTTTSSSASSTAALVIKAAHNTAIILLRAEADLPLGEIRRRLREKFLGQEGVTLSDTFALAYMVPATPAKGTVSSRSRANSTGNLTDAALMEMITTEEEWARLKSSLEGTKLTLRVMDSASSTT
ncbi:hypothetical protein B0H17DRAFT_1174558 [Mycena rosella]|uniref:PX domain-containing protein n=1 Tax=Mycena rosella TaxID=1033263 RepID=A0AAD7MA41_MYCRO|nr:hypothetical protein B0H17DRAFT_1174558 [Mycena rosella]